MAKRIIEIDVNDEYVLGSGVVIGAAGSDNSVILRVKFNDKWLGLNVYATFRDSKGENPVAVLLCPTMVQDSDGETVTYDIEVPSNATAIDGKMCVVFSGFVVTGTKTYNAEEDKYDQLVYRDAVINTANAYFRVLPSDFSALDEEDQKVATPLEQLLGEINVFREELTETNSTINTRLAAQDKKIAEQNSTINTRLTAQDKKIAGRIGDGGSVTLATSKWSSENSQTVTIADIGDDDLVIFYPSTANDREYCGLYGVFISPESVGNSFAITARERPKQSILLEYYIIRGRLPEIREVD